ncbi:MAG: hypothetical protein U0556_03435 [Dehalococcoidia bacterium]
MTHSPASPQRLAAMLTMLLVFWLAIGTPVRSMPIGLYHLHADESARPLDDHAGDHKHAEVVEIDWAESPLVSVSVAGGFEQAVVTALVLIAALLLRGNRLPAAVEEIVGHRTRPPYHPPGFPFSR